MKKTEKIIAAVLTMVVGVLLIVLKDNFIGILMTVAGACLVALGIADICNKLIPTAVLKIAVGVLIAVCGWIVVEAVLYIVSAILLAAGIYLIYDRIKRRISCVTVWKFIYEYALSAVCIVIGALLLFHRGNAVNFIFIFSGILTVIEGGVLLAGVFTEN